MYLRILNNQMLIVSTYNIFINQNQTNMKNKLISAFAIISLISSASFAVNDNYVETNNYTPQGGSLSNTLSANGNSASNNGAIGTSSSATANKLDSSITGVQRFDTSNNQIGNSRANVGDITNQAFGGAGGRATSSSGGNKLTNDQGQFQGQGQGQEMEQGQSQSNRQGQSSANSNNSGASGNSTTVSSNSVYNIPRQAAPLPGQINVQAPGTSGGNFAISTPFGGVGFGLNKTVKEMKTLLNSQAAEVDQRANAQYVENVIKACSIVSEEQCLELKERLMGRLQ